MNLNENKINKIVKKILNEKLDNSRINVVKLAYNEIISAVKGWGTDPDKVLKAVKKLKNWEDFKYLIKLFKDKKTGYSKFSEMVNSEYDEFNFEDVQLLYKQLKSIGVNTTFSSEDELFNGGFKIVNYSRPQTDCWVDKNCQSSWQKELPKAIKFWKDWLNHPVTKKKVQANWDAWYLPGKITISFYYPVFFKMLDNLKLRFYSCKILSLDGIETHQDSIAYVTPFYNQKYIYVNCSMAEDKKLDTLIHEIQHLIYSIKPLNPEKKLSQLFVKKNSNKESAQSIMNTVVSSKSKSNNYSQNVLKTAKTLNIQPDKLQYLKDSVQSLIDKGYKDYICDKDEKMSNIMSIRRSLKVQPGQNITLQMLLPYLQDPIKLNEDADLYWYIHCWASKGFPDINQLLNRTNELAKADQNQGVPTNNVNYLDRNQVS